MAFKQIEPVDDIAEVLDKAFGIKLDLSGGWGYDNLSAVKVNSLDMPIDQFLHTFAAMRANIEMNLTLSEEERYGGINATFVDGKQVEIEKKSFDMITFNITAMREKEYAKFIQEYKDNYGINEEFDLTDHFNRRKEATLSIESDFWFEGLEQYYHEEEMEEES
jgi:hypothetical protein